MKTIFDIGLHEGCDAEFYLEKGFRVIAVEANPELASTVRMRLAAQIASGQLVVLTKAIAERSGMSISFYVRPEKNGWSSIYQDLAERDGVASTRVDVETVTIGDLFAEFGPPYYLKCDIEGADPIVLAQIAASPVRPRFVSVEIPGDGGGMIDLLADAGYSHFQLVNQSYLSLSRPPNPPREGAYVTMRSPGKMSGLFGEELKPNYWVTEDKIRGQLCRWQDLASGEIGSIRRFLLRKYGKWTGRTWLIGRGWMDIHARLDDRQVA